MNLSRKYIKLQRDKFKKTLSFLQNKGYHWGIDSDGKFTNLLYDIFLEKNQENIYIFLDKSMCLGYSFFDEDDRIILYEEITLNLFREEKLKRILK